MPKYFIVTEQHLALLRNVEVSWISIDFGAPAIDPKRPYGNSSVYADIADILKISSSGDSDNSFTEEQYQYMRRLHQETKIALQIFLKTGKMEIGKYVVLSDYTNDWHKEEK